MGAKVEDVAGAEANQSTIHSSVRSAMRKARFELGVMSLCVRSEGGMTMSGWRVCAAEMYSAIVSGWKPVEVKTEIALEVFPRGEGTAGRRRGLRMVVIEDGVAVKACRRVVCF